MIIEGFLTADQMQRFGSEIAHGMEEIGAATAVEGLKEGDALYELVGEKTKRLGQLAVASSVFRHEFLEHDLMHALLEKVFVEGPMDGYWMNASEVIELAPGSKPQPLHRDQELYPAWNRAGPTMPEAICNFFSALTPFTALNGATQVAPGTHLDLRFGNTLDPNAPDYSAVETIPAIMNPGDCAFFSGKLLHGAGWNQTSSEHRRGLAMSFIRSMLMPEQAHPLSVPRHIAGSMAYRGQAMLGFRSQWPVNGQSHAFYWSHQNTDIGNYIGLAHK